MIVLLFPGPYANGNPDMVLKRQKTRLKSSHRKSAGDSGSDFDDIRGRFCYGSQVGQVMRKCVLCYMRTTKVQISLRIRAVISAPLLFAAYIV